MTTAMAMDEAALARYLSEALDAGGEGVESPDLADAVSYARALAVEPNVRDARWHVVYFATHYTGWKHGGRDATPEEAAALHHLTDRDVAALRDHAAAHPRLNTGAIGDPPALDFGKNELMVAFALQTVAKIIDADGVVQAAELEFMESQFPTRVLEAMGLFEHGRPTDRFERARAAALEILPIVLTLDEKLGLGELFMAASTSDDDLDPREAQWVLWAMELLGVTRTQFADHVQRMAGR